MSGYRAFEESREKARHALWVAIANQFLSMMERSGKGVDPYETARLSILEWEQTAWEDFYDTFLGRVADTEMTPEQAAKEIRDLFADRKWGELSPPQQTSSWGKGANHT